MIGAFATALRARRLELGFTQEDLAGASDLDRPFITLMEAGAKQPSLSVLWRLAQGLQVSMPQLAQLIDQRLHAAAPSAADANQPDNEGPEFDGGGP